MNQQITPVPKIPKEKSKLDIATEFANQLKNEFGFELGYDKSKGEKGQYVVLANEGQWRSVFGKYEIVGNDAFCGAKQICLTLNKVGKEWRVYIAALKESYDDVRKIVLEDFCTSCKEKIANAKKTYASKIKECTEKVAELEKNLAKETDLKKIKESCRKVTNELISIIEEARDKMNATVENLKRLTNLAGYSNWFDELISRAESESLRDIAEIREKCKNLEAKLTKLIEMKIPQPITPAVVPVLEVYTFDAAIDALKKLKPQQSIMAYFNESMYNDFLKKYSDDINAGKIEIIKDLKFEPNETKNIVIKKVKE